MSEHNMVLSYVLLAQALNKEVDALLLCGPASTRLPLPIITGSKTDTKKNHIHFLFPSCSSGAISSKSFILRAYD